MSVSNQIVRSSGRALANGATLAGVKLVEKVTVGSHSSGKQIAMESLVMAVSTLGTGVVNSLISSVVSLPSFVISIEETYGLDLVNLILYVMIIKFSSISTGDGKSLVKLTLEGVAAIILGGYVVAPINNMLPWTMTK
jgi:hypothetical protein